MSVEVQIGVAGAEEFAQTLNHFDSDMQRLVQRRLGEWAEGVKVQAANVVPVRTGYLRSTIYTRTKQWQSEVGAQAAYASAVELGTRYQQAKPFLQPALEQSLPSLEQFLLDALDSAKAEANL